MKSGDRGRGQRIRRWERGRCGQGGSGSDKGGGERGPSSDSHSGEQLATAELKIECRTLCGHGPTLLRGSQENLSRLDDICSVVSGRWATGSSDQCQAISEVGK